jgi:hypothetical protein
MNAARGRCDKIYNIYEAHLNPWFQRILEVGEQEELKQLFLLMYHCDSVMLDVIDDLSLWLEAESEAVLTLLLSKDFSSAERRIADARLQTLSSRRAVSRAMSQIQNLEADFIVAAGAS